MQYSASKMSYKVRRFPEHNYLGIYLNGRTLRLKLDPDKPLTELQYPEFYDVRITNWCAGSCPTCYMSSTTTEKHFPDVVGKVEAYFGLMSPNQRPFQVAIGGRQSKSTSRIYSRTGSLP